MNQFKKANKKQLGELLIERGVITRDQLEEALEYQKNNPGKGMVGEVLVVMGHATEEDIAQALTAQYGFPYLPLKSYEIEDEVLKTIPEKMCRQFTLLPIDKIGKSLTLTMSNPLNSVAIQEVELITDCSVQVFVSTSTDLKEAIEKYFS